jgi:hypothetical protein
MTPLTATLTRDRHGQPLVVLDGGPFADVEIKPAALRELAQHLDALARLAVSRNAVGKHRRPLVVTVGDAQQISAHANSPSKTLLKDE